MDTQDKLKNCLKQGEKGERRGKEERVGREERRREKEENVMWAVDEVAIEWDEFTFYSFLYVKIYMIFLFVWRPTLVKYYIII
mgnify:CR=1 FL=1